MNDIVITGYVKNSRPLFVSSGSVKLELASMGPKTHRQKRGERAHKHTKKNGDKRLHHEKHEQTLAKFNVSEYERKLVKHIL